VLPFRLIYHDGYNLNIGDHVFPAVKYKLIRERLIADGFAVEEDFLQPEAASDADILLVHDPGYVTRLKTGTLSYAEVAKLEIPYSQKMVQAFWLAAGGTILAAERAMADGVGFNVGGGFHHAFAGHGEGFCAIHDVAVAVRSLQHRGLIRKALIVDCDVHHGNGTAAIFAGDESVLTISLHQFHNYPAQKPASSIDVHLADGVGDAEYLVKLREVLTRSIPMFQPDILFYVAGADPYFQDQLGGLSLTLTGLRERDRIVFREANELRIPVVVTLAGGYAVEVADTVTIQANTAKVALLRWLQPHLIGELVELRPLRVEDWEALYAVASDPLIWEQHPASDRYQEAVFREFFQGALDSGGAFVVLDRSSGATIGSTRYSGYQSGRNQIEIGWTFLARSYWGGRYNGEMKRLLLAHAFQFVEHVVFLVGSTNIRSQTALARIGAVQVGREEANLRGRLVEHFVYRISKS